MKRKISFILALIIAFTCFASCGKSGYTDTQASASETLATDQSGDIIYSSIIYPETYASKLKFSLSASDTKAYYDQLAVCRKIYFGNNKEDADKLKSELYKLASLKAVIETQRDIAYMLYCADTSSSAARNDYQYAEGVYASADTKLVSFYTDAKNGKNSLIQVVLKFIKEAYPQGFVSRTSEASGYYAIMEKASADFGALSTVNAQNVLPIFQKYVDASKKFAESSGYRNYYEYAAKEIYKRDYSASEREKFREYVKEYLVPLCRELKALSYKTSESLTYGERTLSDSYLNADYETVGRNLFSGYCAALKESSGDAIMSAFREDRIFVGSKRSSRARAFVTDVGGAPMCYLNANAKDIVTVSHELGHYYAHRAGMGDKTSYDLREAHSQTNSLLFVRYLEAKLSKNAHRDFEIYSVYNTVYTAVSHAIRDEFDEIVFSSDKEKVYTAEELEEIMAGLIEEYGISDILSDRMRSDLLSYWYRLGMTDACYNISYSMGAVTALQIYAKSFDSFGDAAEAYRVITEDIDKSRTFVGTLDRAGISSPFSDKAYAAISGIADKFGG